MVLTSLILTESEAKKAEENTQKSTKAETQLKQNQPVWQARLHDYTYTMLQCPFLGFAIKFCYPGQSATMPSAWRFRCFPGVQNRPDLSPLGALLPDPFAPRPGFFLVGWANAFSWAIRSSLGGLQIVSDC